MSVRHNYILQRVISNLRSTGDFYAAHGGRGIATPESYADAHLNVTYALHHMVEFKPANMYLPGMRIARVHRDVMDAICYGFPNPEHIRNMLTPPEWQLFEACKEWLTEHPNNTVK